MPVVWRRRCKSPGGYYADSEETRRGGEEPLPRSRSLALVTAVVSNYFWTEGRKDMMN